MIKYTFKFCEKNQIFLEVDEKDQIHSYMDFILLKVKLKFNFNYFIFVRQKKYI